MTHRYKTVVILLLSALPVVSYATDASVLCGGPTDKLWAWAWAGANGSNVQLNQNNFGSEIMTMGDLSGNGNDYFNNDPHNQDPPTRPAYRSSLSKNGWSTSLPIIASDRYDSGANAYLQYMHQSNDMVASGGFYLAFAGLDSREDGHRIIWGTTSNDRVRYDQLENRLDITIAGNNITLTGKNAWTDGPILVEVWRDSSSRLHAWINGTDQTSGQINSSATFRLNGIGGGDPSGSSAFDDHAFEYIACDGTPTSTQRYAVREYLRTKWQLYGNGGPPPIQPHSPSNFGAN